jgi:predicted nucleic acid-binding protein
MLPGGPGATSCMTAGNSMFVDTNVILYSLDTADARKQSAAKKWLEFLWASRSGHLSWQVLNECYNNATRKIGAPPSAVRPAIEAYVEWRPVEFSLPILRRAWHWMDSAGIGYWDSLILAAAENLRCRWLLSEDFQAGRTYGSVQVVNPFETDPHSFFSAPFPDPIV